MKPEPSIADEAEWLALRRQIEQAVALDESAIHVAGQEIPWFRVSDPERVLTQAVELEAADSAAVEHEGVESEHVAGHDPFWAASWRSASGLDRFLGGLDLRGKHILELGCGCGRVGISAALRGGLVTMTDAVVLALQVAQLNSWPWRDTITFQQLVWGKNLLAERSYPIILGSDIVYDVNCFEPLESSARYHLTSRGKFYVGEPQRESGRLFWHYMLDSGWQVQRHSIDLQDDLPPIRIFECRLP